MMRQESEINGYAIHASDGLIGSVSDFLFDDTTWVVRWLVVDTGSWLSGRKVLISPTVLGHVNHIGHQFNVKLTRQQVKDSPDIDMDRPVSRQMETGIYLYYGWSPYWTSDSYISALGFGGGYLGGSLQPPPRAPSVRAESTAAMSQRRADDAHLRSIHEVTGYHIHASDGEIGHVADVLVDDDDWSIHYLVVDTKNWWPGRKVLTSPNSVQAIHWAGRLINLNSDRQKVKDSPEYNSTTTVDPAYERRLHSHYGDVRPG